MQVYWMHMLVYQLTFVSDETVTGATVNYVNV